MHDAKNLNIQIQVKINTLNEYNFNENDILIIVTSSTGRGEPPDNAILFWRNLLKSVKKINNKFALLGLGDSNYDHFLGFPQDLRKRLLGLGASEFYKFGKVDDACDSNDVISNWYNGLRKYLLKLLDKKNNT